MRITFVLPNGMSLGGVTTWSITMANALSARNRDVILLEHVRQHAVSVESISPRVRVIKHYGEHPYDAGFSDVAKYVASYRQALPGIMIPNFQPGSYATCALLSQNHATEMRVIAFAHADSNFYYDLLDYYEPIIHCFIAVSQEVAHRLAQRLPHRAEDIVTRPYGVQVPPALQRTWTPPCQPLKLMYAGRLVEHQKRVSDLARLAAILSANDVDYQLEIVGDGFDKESLAASIARMMTLNPSAQNRISLLGSLPHAQILQKWQRADVCLLVSEFEGTSIAMLEAMAAGSVPVVTAVSGAISIITPGANGYLVDVGDVDTMAKIIQELAADRCHLASLGQNAHQTAQRNFSFDAYLDWFLALLDRVGAQPARSWPPGKPVLPPRPPVSLIGRTRHMGKRALRRLVANIKERLQ